MLNRESRPSAIQETLTLKIAPRRERVSRLLPCGTLGRDAEGSGCAVFLKRSRMSSTVLRKVLQHRPHYAPAAERARNRPGSFLRLGSGRSH
ncbi:MAG TPA: hypothetical protein VNJ47_13490 [Nevskiales bacterium]|nr:hypothetical protein [Nevskiales bacterium]